MPSINNVIARVKELKPSPLRDEDMARYLMELDGRIYKELTAADHPEMTPPAAWPEDGDKQLLVQAPYDVLYDHYLTAMIEYWMREYGNYNNTVALFQQAYDEYRAWYRRTHRPEKRRVTGLFR